MSESQATSKPTEAKIKNGNGHIVQNGQSTKDGDGVDYHGFLSFLPVPLQLSICVSGIYGCYFTYGFLQEKIISVEKIDASVPLFFQYCIALVLSLSINYALNRSGKGDGRYVTYSGMKIGCYNSLTVMCSNYALGYIDYPTQALVKSSKIIPVITLGYFTKTYDHKLHKYVCAILITVGLIIFNIAKLGNKVGDMSFNAFGMTLLGLSLFGDGLVAISSDKDKKETKDNNTYHLMTANNIIGILISVGLMGFGHITTGTHPLSSVSYYNFNELLLIGAVSAFGQIFIYTTIACFDCFLLSVVNTSRKFFSIFFSIVWFGHKIGTLHMIGIVIVIGSIIADMIISEMDRHKKKQKATKNE